MREENHDLYSIAAKTRVTISWSEETETFVTKKKTRFPKNVKTPVTLTFSPQNSEYGDIFKNAGLDIKPLEFNDTTNKPVVEKTPTLEDLLKDFK